MFASVVVSHQNQQRQYADADQQIQEVRLNPAMLKTADRSRNAQDQQGGRLNDFFENCFGRMFRVMRFERKWTFGKQAVAFGPQYPGEPLVYDACK